MLSAQAGLGGAAVQVCAVDDLVLGASSASVLKASKVVLVADVRLDNRNELADALNVVAPARRNVSDPELLLAALLRWQEEAVDRLIGDFSFACFDAERQRLLLARDPLGQRPLFWRRDRAGFAFSSMPRGLHAGGAQRAPDLLTTARYVAGLSQDGEESFHAGVQRVRPGHLLIVTPDRQTSVRHWNPPQHVQHLPRFEDAVASFRFELDRAVGSRLEAGEDRIAAHLSGGWDSSAVTATAARLIGADRKLLAFTAVPGGHPTTATAARFADEGPLAARTAALYPNIDHRLIASEGSSIVDMLDQGAPWFERPPFNPCNHGWLARIRTAASEAGAEVLLTGEIGNWTISAAPASLLADYVRQRRLRDWWREAAAMSRQGRARWRGIAAASFAPWLPTPVWRRLQDLSAGAGIETALHPDFRAMLADECDEQLFGAPSRPSDNRARTQAAFEQMDFGQYRHGILTGWGIDKRDATADRRLLEFCLTLPIDLLLRDGVRRPLARAALSDRLPSAVLDERRKGLQAATWHLDFARDRPRIEALLDRFERDPAAASLVDTALLRRWLRAWPSEGWERPGLVARYRVAFLVALAAGHFVLHASG